MNTNPQFPAPQIGLLTETSWEVCNKIGGIYTVLSTKARVLKETYGDKLVFIGPDVWTSDNPSSVFIERKTLLKQASSKLRLPWDISIRVGRWNIPGSPVVVLVKFDGVYSHLDPIYGDMWEHFKVDSLHSYGDYAEGCAFAVASAIVTMALADHLKVARGNVVAHFNEWTTAMGLLYLKLNSPQTATVFTTHATSIGRSICGNGKPLYDYFTGYNGDQMAAELNMQSKHSLEKAAAHQADCFTAVSEITARECGQLLEIRPQVVTPNGFEPDFVPGAASYAALRAKGRARLIEVASILRGRKFADDVFMVATSGRNEYRNKGLDLFIDSMAQLDDDKPAGDVLAFILTPAWVKEPSGALIVDMADGGRVQPTPDFITHRLNNEDSDMVFGRLRDLEAQGRFHGKVHVIYVPVYLDGHDGIVDISYYDLLPAFDMSVFPSYYEPWGYTPLESVAFGVPTVTTDKAGFGQWVSATFNGSLLHTGVDVVARTDSNYQLAAHAIAATVARYQALPLSGKEEAMAAARATAARANWKFFIEKYYEAFTVAEKRRDARLDITDNKNLK